MNAQNAWREGSQNVYFPTERDSNFETLLQRILLCAEPQQAKIEIKAVFGRIDFMLPS